MYWAFVVAGLHETYLGHNQAHSARASCDGDGLHPTAPDGAIRTPINFPVKRSVRNDRALHLRVQGACTFFVPLYSCHLTPHT